MKKYEFTGEIRKIEGVTLQRIRYIENISWIVKKGDLGGWIESEHNLSHFGKCVVLQDGKVYGNAKIIENAKVSQNSVVKDNALIKGNSEARWDAIIGADTVVSDEAIIEGESKIFFYKNVSSDNTSNISGDSVISNSEIEAIGRIHNTTMVNQNISGFLDIENQVL